jgi:hypothetical protein
MLPTVTGHVEITVRRTERHDLNAVGIKIEKYRAARDGLPPA